MDRKQQWEMGMGSLWNRSGVVERYGAADLPARSAKAFFFQGGTLTPMVVFADAAEGSAHTHPVVADANGRWPNVFVPYTLSYDVQVLNQFDVELTYTQEIPNPDPVELTVEVPPTLPPGTVLGLTTGMTHWEPIHGAKVGFVRCNGRTIGNGVSLATERANDDCEPLFTYLWLALADAQAPVGGGRGASPGGDFLAGKTIQIPDLRGALPVGLDGMGNSAGGFFTGVPTVSGNPTTPGSTVGVNSATLSSAQLPAHTHPFTPTGGGGSTSHSHSYERYNQLPRIEYTLNPAGSLIWQGASTIQTGATAAGGGSTGGTVGANTGGGSPLSTMPRVITGTWYMKL